MNQALKLRPNYAKAYFNLGVLFLDAEKFPGLDKLKQLQIATANLNKYKQLRRLETPRIPSIPTWIAPSARSTRAASHRAGKEAHGPRGSQGRRRAKAQEAAEKSPEKGQ